MADLRRKNAQNAFGEEPVAFEHIVDQDYIQSANKKLNLNTSPSLDHFQPTQQNGNFESLLYDPISNYKFDSSEVSDHFYLSSNQNRQNEICNNVTFSATTNDPLYHDIPNHNQSPSSSSLKIDSSASSPISTSPNTQEFAQNLQALTNILSTPICMPPQHTQSSFVPSVVEQPNQNCSRTIYIGGLPKGVTPAEILYCVKGGLVEKFRYISDKNCAFIDFVDAYGANSFYKRHCLNRLHIKGNDVKVGWAKDTPLSGEIYAAVQNGATRCIFLGSLDSSYSEYILNTEFSVFGPLESIRLISEKRIAFEQFLNISSAIRAMSEFGKNPRWVSKRISYGKDHCVEYSTTKTNYDAHNYNVIAEHTAALNDAIASNNRTVYLGNLPEDITMEDICNTIKTGAIQNLRYLPEKNCCFVCFLESSAAQTLYRNAAFHGLFINGNKLKPGWGKSAPLPGHLQHAIKRGITRNVYIGGISESVTVEELRKDFEQYGETEQIRIIRDKNTAFVCFCNIEHAIKAIEKSKTDPQYSSLKVRFGKDRCAPSLHSTSNH